MNVCGILDGPPTLKWKCKSNKLYTIVLISLTPLSPAYSTLLGDGILWWRVDVKCNDAKSGKAIFEYEPPLPLDTSEEDRFVFLAYEQPNYQIDWSEEQHVPT